MSETVIAEEAPVTVRGNGRVYLIATYVLTVSITLACIAGIVADELATLAVIYSTLGLIAAGFLVLHLGIDRLVSGRRIWIHLAALFILGLVPFCFLAALGSH